MMNTTISLNQIGLYNPQRQSSEVTEKLFVVRQKQFELLMEKLADEEKNSIPQHHLIIAQRGMGKTTMLKRIEVELHKEKYRELFIPLLFPEEQYNLKDLAEFWLNCLDALADTLEVEGSDREEIAKIDGSIKELMAIKKPEEIAEKAYFFLMDFCSLIQRRPVLLIDNIGLVFSRLIEKEQWVLRENLSKNGAPIIVGASAKVAKDIVEYKMPFYDYFQMHYLNKLSFEEFMELLKNLAIVTQSDKELLPIMQQQISRLKALYQLTGGNPRTSVMLFKLIGKGFSPEIKDDLDALLDEATPLYKSRFEDLSDQQQIIVDAIALNWDAINLNKLSKETRYKNNQLSPQLKRLIEEGWIDTTSAFDAKGNAYFISERFFNIWFLMRRSSRRQKREVYCLSRFLESLYGDDLSEFAKKSLISEVMTYQDLFIKRCLWEALKGKGDVSLQNKMKKSLCKDILKFSEENNDIAQNEIYAELIKKRKNQKKNVNNFSLGLSLYVKAEYSESEEAFRKSVALDEKDANNWYWLGISLNKQAKYSESEEAFRKSVNLDEKRANSWYWLGLSLYEQQKYLASEEAFRKSVVLDEKDTYNWYWLGLLLYAQQKYSESEEAFRKSVALDEKDADNWYSLGLSLYGQAKYSESEEAFKKSVALDEKDVNSWVMLGALYQLNLKNYEEAEISYKKVLERDSECSQYWYRLGFLYHYQLKKYEDAEKSYKKAIELDPEYLNSKWGLTFLYRDKLNRLDEAKGLFNSLKEDKEKTQDFYFLEETLFALHSRNEGIAKEYLLEAVDVIQDKFPQKEQNDWNRFAVITIDLGYGEWFLNVLKEKGCDVILAPYYIAVQALEYEKTRGKEQAEIYLKNKAVEVSEPARMIIEQMSRYM